MLVQWSSLLPLHVCVVANKVEGVGESENQVLLGATITLFVHLESKDSLLCVAH